MPKSGRDQRYPPHARDAKSYYLAASANNLSRDGTLRSERWPTILKFDGHPDGVALAHREAGVTKRHLHMLERYGLLRFDTSPASPGASPLGSPGGARPPATVAPESDESRYPEGAESYRTHKHLERDGDLPRQAKEKRLAEVGHLACDVCGFNFCKTYGSLGEGFIEAHHTVPVSAMRGSRLTNIAELALVCSNCHRMLHRGGRLLSIEDLKAVLAGAGET